MSTRSLTYSTIANDGKAILNDGLAEKIVFGCNLACPHCHSFSPFRSGFTKLETFIDTHKRLNENAHISGVCFTGGEPLLHPQLKELLDWTADFYQCRTTIWTNGTLLQNLEQDVLDTLAEKAELWISVKAADGYADTVADIYRGIKKMLKTAPDDMPFHIRSNGFIKSWSEDIYNFDLNIRKKLRGKKLPDPPEIPDEMRFRTNDYAAGATACYGTAAYKACADCWAKYTGAYYKVAEKVYFCYRPADISNGCDGIASRWLDYIDRPEDYFTVASTPREIVDFCNRRYEGKRTCETCFGNQIDVFRPIEVLPKKYTFIHNQWQDLTLAGWVADVEKIAEKYKPFQEFIETAEKESDMLMSAV